jgi:AbrB family looped-hinge helix DNA binding protein
MRITSKGQVTIPLAIRKKAGLLPTTEVEFTVKGDTVILRRAARAPRRGPRLLEALRGRGTTRLSTDEIMALTRGR